MKRSQRRCARSVVGVDGDEVVTLKLLTDSAGNGQRRMGSGTFAIYQLTSVKWLKVEFF